MKENKIVDFSLTALQEAIANTEYKQEDLDTPWWPSINGHVAMRDVSTVDLERIQPLAEKSKAMYSGALLQFVLVKRSTGERIFTPDQRSILENLGGSISLPLMLKVQAFLGLSKSAIEDAKKN